MPVLPLALILLFCLAGCDLPSLSMRNVPGQRVEIGQMEFNVRIKGDRAEIIRISRNWLPGKRRVFDAATMAAERVAGCPVRSVSGDQAIVLARLRCKDAPPPVPAVVIVLDPI